MPHPSTPECCYKAFVIYEATECPRAGDRQPRGMYCRLDGQVILGPSLSSRGVWRRDPAERLHFSIGSIPPHFHCVLPACTLRFDAIIPIFCFHFFVSLTHFQYVAYRRIDLEKAISGRPIGPLLPLAFAPTFRCDQYAHTHILNFKQLTFCYVVRPTSAVFPLLFLGRLFSFFFFL